MHQDRLLVFCTGWYLLLACALADCDHAFTVSQQLQETECTADGSCGSLQSAVDSALLISVNAASQSCISFTVPNGRHFITAPAFFHSDLSVHFLGSGNDVTLLCSYPAPPSQTLVPFSSSSDPKHYTWYFNQSESVSFENLNFEGCPYPIRLDTVATLSIRDCSFSYFREAALDVYNCQNVTISDTRVEHNRGTGIVHIPYRGNTGAVSLGFNDVPPHLSSPRVEISNCTFTNNSATAESVFLTPSQAFSNQFFTGRGGGMGIFMNDSFHNLSISIRDCIYQKNFARSFGGGFYMVFNGFNTQHIVSTQGTHLLSNTGGVGGGGIQVAYIASGVPAVPHTVEVSDCVFRNNTSPSGGGIYIYPSFLGGPGNLARLRRCHFIGNQGVGRATDYGAAVAMALLQLFGQVSTLPRHEVEDCVFQENSGANGIVSVGYSPMKFLGNNTFVANTGTTLRIIGTVVEFYGSLTFRNNIAIETSALHLLSFGQVLFTHGLTVTFEGNIGRFGASILIDTPTSSIAFDQVPFNPQCFVLYEELDVRPSQWTDVDIFFINNSAVLGSALYIARVDTCSWFSLAPPFFNNSFILDWPVWKFGNNTNTGYDDPTNRDFYIETTAVRLDIANSNVTAWPGQSFSVSLTGLDQFDHQTTTSTRFLFSQAGMGSEAPAIRLNPEVILIDADTEDGTLEDQVTLIYWVTDDVSATDFGNTLGTVQVEVFDALPVMAESFPLLAAPCPGGYFLTASGLMLGGSICGCKDIPEVIHCESDQDTIVIKRGYWAVYVPGDENRNLHFYPCPPGYCRCSQNTSLGNTRCVFTFTNSDPDLQCACGRKGILCGQCRSGKGVSALLSRCVTCRDASGMLILALIVVDVLVFLGVALLDVPLPPWVYPFLFYLQLVPYVAVHFPESFESVGKYLFFISSALGFYFPYDFCLHGSMSALVSYAVRYIPTLVAVVVYPTVVIFRHCRHMKSLQHHGLWWAGLLLYTTLLHTSMSVLDCPSVPEADGSSTIRWFINGQVQCFAGGHLPLALLAIFVLLVCLALIPLTAAVATDRLRRPLWLRQLAEPLGVSFRRELRWWPAVELGRRVLFLVFLVPFPRNIVPPMLVLAITITVYGFLQPYRGLFANAMEIFLQIDFLLLLMLRITPIIQDQYLVFPSPPPSSSVDGDRCFDSIAGVAKITWVLTPFYYVPLLVLVLTAVVYSVLSVRRRYAQRVRVPLIVEVPKQQPVEVFVQSLVIGEQEDEDSGYINLTGGSTSRDSTRL